MLAASTWKNWRNWLRVSLRPVQPGSHAAECRFLRVVEKVKRPTPRLPLVGAPFGLADPGEVPSAAGEGPPGILVGLRGEADLLESRATGDSPRRLAGALHGRQRHLENESDDADHDQELDQGESVTAGGRAAGRGIPTLHDRLRFGFGFVWLSRIRARTSGTNRTATSTATKRALQTNHVVRDHSRTSS